MRVTTLPNGLRVSTQETYGQISTFALFVDAGSMYEQGPELGACHVLESTAFKASAGRSSDEIARFSQSHGITTSAVFNREVFMYKVDSLRGAAAASLALLADAVQRPLFTPADLNTAAQVIAFQRDEALSQPQVLVSECLYAAAYGSETPLGRPEKCPPGGGAGLSPDVLAGFQAKYFTAPRMVLSGVGVDHEEAVALAKSLFGALRTESAPGALVGRPSSSRLHDAAMAAGSGGLLDVRTVVGPYLGGDVRISPDWTTAPATANPGMAKTEFTHMMLAFPTVGWSEHDVVPVCVVDTLLGGGSAFSAGGPGKGMYSRLYREVLNTYSWVEAANAFSAQLYDCGLVGIYGAAPPDHAGSLVNVLSTHLLRLTEAPVRAAELSRARNQLASSVMMNLETRALLCEDIGRQFLSHGKRLDPTKLCERIQAVTPEDVTRVMRAALAFPPSFAAVGPGASLPDAAAIAGYFGGGTSLRRDKVVQRL